MQPHPIPHPVKKTIPLKSLPMLITLLLSHLTYGQTQPLFKILQQERTGNMNAQGRVVIAPVYRNGNDFSEGLAAVRLQGTWGYINEQGKWVIPPVYDLATNFCQGLALVYVNGEPQVIDKKGNAVLPTDYRSFSFLSGSKGIVTTTTNKQGIIDMYTNELLADTIYSSIGTFSNGVALAYEYIAPGAKGRLKKIAVIDTAGNVVVPFGKYVNINKFYDGLATVEIRNKNNKEGHDDGVISTKGKLLFQKTFGNKSYLSGDFHDGLAVISLYKYWIPEAKGVYSTSEKSYQGYINLKGEIVYNDTNCRYANDFANGRAFIQSQDDSYRLIDRNFKQVGDLHFTSIESETFNNGYAIVSAGNGAVIIDTAGKIVSPDSYDDIDRAGVVNGYFFFTEESERADPFYGIASLDGTTVSKAVLDDVDRAGFINGLIKVIKDGRLAYLNKKGDMIWQQEEDTLTALKQLDIDYMYRGYFYAYSTPANRKEEESGGWAVSHNIPKPVNPNDFPGNALAITIQTNTVDTFAGEFTGYRLYITNTTGDTIHFNAQDSRLYMNLQAQDKQGEWKDIEYLPSSWCGNSYHTLALEPNAGWRFTIPDYHGEIQTKIRAKLRYIDAQHPKEDKIVYSNTISGSINPGQFWNKRTYYPGGIMDPYND